MKPTLLAGLVTSLALGLASPTALASRVPPRTTAASSARPASPTPAASRAATGATSRGQASLNRSQGRQAAATAPTAAPRGLSQQVQTQVRQYTSSMESFIQGARDTPRMEIVNASPNAQLSRTHFGDYTNSPPRFSVTGLGSTGSLSLVTLMPVSGHVGADTARDFARNNRYNIVIRHADGTQQTLPKVASTGYVTEHLLNLNLKQGKTVIQFWPDGSGGVGGYRAGREVELNWDGR